MCKNFLKMTYWLTLAVSLFSAPAQADDALNKVAEARISAFVQAVVTGPDAVAPLLAPEFQIMRSNGVGYDHDGYLGRGAGSVNALPRYVLSDIVATSSGGLLVNRYLLEIEETIDGQSVTKRAPRMTVFRNIDGTWKISAHANFAHIE